MQHQGKITLRWAVLLVIILNVCFNFTYSYFFRMPSVDSVSANYETLFTPAGYVFSIWGVIYMSFLIYGVYQLMPSQSQKPIYDQLAMPMIIINALAAIWIACFVNGYITTSLCIITIMLVTGAIAYSRLNSSQYQYSYRIKFPFRIFFGWITVATIVNLSLWIEYLRMEIPGISETVLTVVFISLATLAGLGVSYRFKDRIYPLVICWACIGIGVQAFYKSEVVSTAAFIASAMLLLWIVNAIVVYYMPYNGTSPLSESKNPQSASWH